MNQNYYKKYIKYKKKYLQLKGGMIIEPSYIVEDLKSDDIPILVELAFMDIQNCFCLIFETSSSENILERKELLRKYLENLCSEINLKVKIRVVKCNGYIIGYYKYSLIYSGLTINDLIKDSDSMIFEMENEIKIAEPNEIGILKKLILTEYEKKEFYVYFKDKFSEIPFNILQLESMCSFSSFNKYYPFKPNYDEYLISNISRPCIENYKSVGNFIWEDIKKITSKIPELILKPTFITLTIENLNALKFHQKNDVLDLNFIELSKNIDEIFDYSNENIFNKFMTDRKNNLYQSFSLQDIIILKNLVFHIVDEEFYSSTKIDPKIYYYLVSMTEKEIMK